MILCMYRTEGGSHMAKQHDKQFKLDVLKKAINILGK